jgi:hypothetical protein
MYTDQHTIGGTASKPHIKVSTHSSTLPPAPPGKKRGGKQGGKKVKGSSGGNGDVQHGEVDSEDESSTGGSGDAAAVMQGITVSSALDGRALQKLVKLAALLPRYLLDCCFHYLQPFT